MKVDEQIPRNALVWIMLGMAALLAPHLGRLPIWVLVVYIACALWRLQIFRGAWHFPRRLVKLGLIAMAGTGIWLSYGSLLGLEPTVALLLTAYAMKLLELARRQDAYVLLFLGYFICITEFLFTQDLLVVLYSLATVWLVTAALVALHQGVQEHFRFGPLRQSGVMLAQAFPLMLVLFFLFPRIGPLWTVPVKTHAARTGVSDNMSPGSISSLSKSDEVAFRVSFEGEIPPRANLYWRGLVMSRLQQGTWSAFNYYDVPAAERRAAEVATEGEPLRYSVLMMPTQQNWLYSLRYAESSQAGIMQAPDFRLFRPVEIEEQYRYQVRSWPQAALEPVLSDWRRLAELRLPDSENPRTRALALQLREEAGSDAGLVEAVLARFREESFVYTLQPPLLGENATDQFLFETRRGFCEHYASAFVTLMRAGGVPARVVAGYQGGEVNPVNRTVIVHQFDAHAWAEVWLEGEGWRRVDPTAAVSPSRIEQGLEQALAGEGSFLADSPLSPLRYRRVDWINSLRLRYDALTYRWQSWVVGFNSENQLQLLQRYLGELTAQKFVLILLGSGLLVLLPLAAWLLRQRGGATLDGLSREYLAFCAQLARRGVERAPGEGPRDFARRVAAALPAHAEVVAEVTGLYENAQYAASRDSRRDAAQRIRRSRRRLR
ncbi:transglutaminase TgpA family protein [Parahaliea aestuarii]|uniref:DUF3488 domain-containing protein n=1 Tax=Parahaliea aestuarii TaxID=1852021 RepID=A0A5C8ZTQ1_9GAMM|nr:DUF3488 and transglutaminase-like domain-containing protein [Parahaliea aestuarii]TXS91050.1 DUF3488 domain-containing protein [Parahaliea aestuarii]